MRIEKLTNNNPSAGKLPASEENPWRLETRKKTVSEDRFRLRRMEHVAPIEQVDWTNIGHVIWRSNNALTKIACPSLDPKPLIQRFERVATKPGKIPKSLASFRYMRQIRKQLIKGLTRIVESDPKQTFCTFTVMNDKWVLTPEQLQAVSPAKILNQFRTHMERAGILKMHGPFICFIHGEFEPTAGIFVIHLHGLSTAEKARALHRLKSTKKHPNDWGYAPTRTKGRPIVVKPLKDMAEQLSYLLQSWWPNRPVVEVRPGVWKRVRKKGRIAEPFHTQYLLWLDRYRLSDLTLLSDVWSPRKKGSAVMRDVYLLAKRC